MQVYEVDRDYVPSQAVLEVMEELDNIDRELKASGKLVDELWDAVAPSHSPECECSKCEDHTEQGRADQEAYEQSKLDQYEANRHSEVAGTHN